MVVRTRKSIFPQAPQRIRLTDLFRCLCREDPQQPIDSFAEILIGIVGARARGSYCISPMNLFRALCPTWRSASLIWKVA
jgi:hypothetical protein